MTLRKKGRRPTPSRPSQIKAKPAKLNDVISGFQNQFWRIQKMAGLIELSVATIPLEEMDETKVRSLLEAMAKADLPPRESHLPHRYKSQDLTGAGQRIMFSAGGSPYYVASLWRADELDESGALRE